VTASAWSPVRRIVVGLGSIVLMAGLIGGPAEAGRGSPSRLSSCWQFVPSPNGIDTNENWLFGVDGAATDDVWAVGRSYLGHENALIEHWDGAAWSVQALFEIGGGDTELMDVDALSATDAWAVGGSAVVDPLIEHWDGTAWTQSPTPNPQKYSHLYSVSAISPDDVWAVGTLVLHWDGLRWTKVAFPDAVLYSVDAVTSDDVWAVGYWNSQPLTEHWDGTVWTVVPNPAASGTLTGVTAISAEDVWAVGQAPGPLSMHWDGAAWTEVPIPVAGTFDYVNEVDASSALDVWAVGEATPNWEDWRGVAQRWGGHRWTERRVPDHYLVDMHFIGLGVVAEGDAWAVGYTDQGSTLTQHLTGC
jgi:hypothetical protein